MTDISFRTSLSDLEILRDNLQQHFADDEVRFGVTETGGGGPDFAKELVEFITIWLPQAWDFVDELLLGAIIVETVSWVRQRAERRFEQGEQEPGKRIIYIYGPDGTVVKAVRVDGADLEVADYTAKVEGTPWEGDRPVLWNPRIHGY